MTIFNGSKLKYPLLEIAKNFKNFLELFMVNIVSLNKTYGEQVLFNDLSLTINRGEKIGLVGRNGHGKSTLFHMILGNVEPDSGKISYPKSYRIGHLEQHLHFTKPTVLEECALGLQPEEEYETWKVERILTGLGFNDKDMERNPNEFSGGYQIRMNLAKLLLSNPDMLMLDEPNNYLDIVAIRWLEKFLKEWEGEFILITHDRSFMDSVATHTVAIHRTKARKIQGDTEKLYDIINQEEEIYEKTRLNEAKKRKQEELFIAKFKARASFASRTQSRVKKLEKQGEMKALEQIEDLELFFNSAHFAANQMMSADKISFSYSGQEPYLIQDFSIFIGKRERICIIGRNGKGKSTLIKMLAGELEPTSGTINQHPALLKGYFGQTNKLDLNNNLTVLEEIKSADRSCTENIARSIAGGLMFSGDNALKKIKVLSGGEKSRVVLGKILVTPCHLLFLDEPTNHLDMQSCDSLIAAIDDFDGTVIMVTHNEQHLRSVATRLIVFDNDKISLYNGTYDEFLSDVGFSDEGY
jgi:ATP-binding cassette subfamily F protein 3